MSIMDTIQVTAAIMVRGSLVLVAQRPPGGRHPGAWEFPGGKVEPGESPEQCLAREIAEELEVAVEVGDKLAQVTHSYPDLDIELMAFECAIKSGEPADVGCSAHVWVHPRDLGDYDLLPPDRELVAAIWPNAGGPPSDG
jgi:mutator protein MutT